MPDEEKALADLSDSLGSDNQAHAIARYVKAALRAHRCPNPNCVFSKPGIPVPAGATVETSFVSLATKTVAQIVDEELAKDAVQGQGDQGGA